MTCFVSKLDKMLGMEWRNDIKDSDVGLHQHNFDLEQIENLTRSISRGFKTYYNLQL